MAENQVTIGDESYKLPEPFIVLATQNPIEQSGTYKLPEAELDRFLLKAYVEYPSYEEEKKILESIHTRASYKTQKILSKADLVTMKKIVSEIHVSDSIYEYATSLVFATRDPEKYSLSDI
jgi:MoxR-like ATPase